MSKIHLVSESVCKGHPDKLADQISDSILDAALKQDKNSRVAVESLVAKDLIVLAGEVSTQTKLNYEKIARQVIKDNGYIYPQWGFSDKSKILIDIHEQSPEISQGVDKKNERTAIGAGDQGFAYGYACNETKNFMPLTIELANLITSQLDQAREEATIPNLRPDGKSQITILYENDQPIEVTHVTVAVPHDQSKKLSQLKYEIIEQIIGPTLIEYGFSLPSGNNIIINGTGVWHNPGPASDTGLTGRKIVVDTYGGIGKVGGGAFSGKDPSKIDRSAAYLARYLAKNVVANNLADKAEISLAYYIGAKEAIFQNINTFGTEKRNPEFIEEFVRSLASTDVKSIIEKFSLDSTEYIKTAQNGHFGKPSFPWEKLTKIKA